MTLYTTMPMETVWDGAMTYTPQFVEIEINGMLVQAAPIDSQRAVIVRLLRCELSDYLNPAYAPGQQICYFPAVQSNQPNQFSPIV
ncbi:YlzJ-like family protein [Paenibacillus sediminis]|uniref:YlzJ-like protein n=1 Tax=Paenibacillus sediminis TaxID=664909 RepID=A0ABS4H1F4_9BACL|nr:YlzJ-like family protein [Paenibacillus sediminis]MBP1936363.1 hypothetical protein [Paenibacillus sediminis]